MAEQWNLMSVEPLDDTNYFLWSEKVEGILRAKKLWKKVINVKPPEIPEEGAENYEIGIKLWNKWDDNNYAARAIMINTMSKSQLLKYSHEKNADRPWALIKNNMAAETEELKTRSLSELSNLKMKRDETIDEYMNRAEALRNQCMQLGRIVENYELRMYIIGGLRPEFDQNVRVMETQRELTINDIRYALKQEELRKTRRKEEKTSRDEHARKVREKPKNDIICYNCGMKGHKSRECRNKQKCFNCQGYGHIAADCKEPKKNTARGRTSRGNSRTRGMGRNQGRGENTLKTTDETVMRVRDYVQSNDTRDCIWLLDSGATSHMVSDEAILENIEIEKRDISLADKNGKKLYSNGKGETMIKQETCNDRIKLRNVLCVPDINANLLSVAKITDHGYNVKFNKHRAIVYRDNKEILMTAEREENAYYVKTSISTEKAGVINDTDIWHKRLGHTNKKTVEEMRKEDLVTGMEEKGKEMRQCEPCVEGKMCRKPHPRLPGRKTTRIMELWHMDLIGPIKPSSYGGKKYILTIVDDYSRVIFIELLKEKGEAAKKLKELIVLKENQMELKLKAIRTDNGGEFTGKGLEEWLKEKGIKHELSPARTPQCNGIAERANKSIIEITRAMIADSKMPLEFWAEAVHTAVHIKNRSKSTVHKITPYQAWNDKKPNIKYMRRFGCMAYVLDKEQGRKKFEPKTIKGIFVGYSSNNAYRIYIPETRRIKIDCDVKFDESINGRELITEIKNKSKINGEELTVIGLESGDEDELIEEKKETDMDNDDRRTENDEIEDTEDSNYEDDYVTESDSEYDTPEGENMNELQEQCVEERHAGRPKGTSKASMEEKRKLMREEEEKRLQEQNVRRSERIKNQQSARLVMDEEIPKKLEEAEKSNNWEYWKRAMDEELASMKKHKVWDVVSRPKDKKIIKCKWVYDIKDDPNTNGKKYKARLVALGCGQRPGVDYEETFAPVVRTETIRILFSISAQEKRKMKLYDVKTAYLHGELKEELYMELPGKTQGNKNQVCKLKKSIYGLKQAGRCWNEYLTEVMKNSGLKQSKEDPCLFYTREKNGFLYCGIHVDDMATVSSDDKIERKYINEIKRKIDIKELGEAKTVLGMQIEQVEGKIYVHQKNYVEKLLQMYGMDECNIVKSPIDINMRMDECEDSERIDAQAYQELVGRLMYLSVQTRPDISYALSCLSQFNSEPRAMHMSALKRILRYLRGTINYCLEYRKRDPIRKVTCEADASWDRTKDAKSFTGLLVYKDGDLIFWKSKKQSTVALSSTESELEALLEGTKEVIWTSRLLHEIGLSEGMVRELRCDNLNAVRLANGGNFKTKSKILNRKCHYIRKTIKQESIFVKHVSNEEMMADCLTKPLSGPALLRQIKEFLNINNR